MGRLLTSLLRWIGIGLYWLGLHRLVIWLHRRDVKVLLYHACEEAESDFTRGLASNTPPAHLAAHLDFLQRYYTVVPLARLEAGSLPDRAVAITFDDGYRSAFTHAFPLLRARGLPATMYLVTDVVDTGGLIWENELNWLLRRHPAVALPLAARAFPGAPGRTPEILHHISAAYDPVRVRALLQEIRAAAGVDGARLAEEARLYVSWDDVREMAQAPIAFGIHTATHANLARLSEPAQQNEIDRARAVLSARVPGAGCRSLAYPGGSHTAATRRVARALGITSLMEVGGRNRTLDLQRVARIPVKASSHSALFAELEVVTPAKTALHRWLAR